MNNINKPEVNNLLPNGQEDDIKECDILKKLGQIVEWNSLKLGELNLEETKNITELINRLNFPDSFKPSQATFDDIKIHMILRQRLKPDYAEDLINHAKFMETHTAPVNFRQPNYKNFLYHMDYREQIEKATGHILSYEWIVMQHFLEAYGIKYGKGSEWNYKPPSRPPTKIRWIPIPNEVYKITNKEYTDNKEVNKFLQYTLFHSFMVGWRNPSELCMLKIKDLDFDKCEIIITEKKKGNKKRQVSVDPQVMNSERKKSFKNWLKWRDKFETTLSEDYLYITPYKGKPVNENNFTSYIQKYVKKVFPKFTTYSTRHWCACSLLIREKINTNYWNLYPVKNHLGHENSDTTDGYVKQAERLIKQAPYDWFKRVLKKSNYGFEDNSLESRKPKKTHVSSGDSSRKKKFVIAKL